MNSHAVDVIARAIASDRTVGLLYKGRARIVHPRIVTSTHLYAWCLNRENYRQFRLARIEDARLGPGIEHLGPDLGPPRRVEEAMTSNLEETTLATVTETAEMVRRLEAMDAFAAGDAYTRFLAAKKRLREFIESAEQAFLERVETIGDIIIQTADGPRRIYAAPDKTKKCLNAHKTFHALLETVGPEVLSQILTTQPFKPAAAIAALGDDWSDYFEIEEKSKLNEGSPKRVLKQSQHDNHSQQEF